MDRFEVVSQEQYRKSLSPQLQPAGKILDFSSRL